MTEKKNDLDGIVKTTTPLIKEFTTGVLMKVIHLISSLWYNNRLLPWCHKMPCVHLLKTKISSSMINEIFFQTFFLQIRKLSFELLLNLMFVIFYWYLFCLITVLGTLMAFFVVTMHDTLMTLFAFAMLDTLMAYLL